MRVIPYRLVEFDSASIVALQTFKHDADDRTIMGRLNHGPELARQVDQNSGLLPIHARLDGFPAASDLMQLYTTTGGCGEHTQQSSGGDNVISVNR